MIAGPRSATKSVRCGIFCGEKMEQWGFQGMGVCMLVGRLLCFSSMLQFEMFDCYVSDFSLYALLRCSEEGVNC